MPGILNSRYFLWILLAFPLVGLANSWRAGDLFYGELIHMSGELSARLLMLTMVITPLRLMFPNSKWPSWLLRRRRYFGIASFVYALVHTAVYLERKRDFSLIVEEGLEFSLLTGWVSFLIIVILAITSNDTSVRFLQCYWKKIHQWVYVAAILLFLHWTLIAFDFVPGLIHCGILLTLEMYRVMKQSRRKG